MMKKQQFANKLALSLAVLLISHVNLVYPQNLYPPALKVPVTYYDFHFDGSNPDFNPGANPAIVLPGMVQPTLDATGLPVGTTSYLYSWGIGKWFRPWKQSLLGQGNDFTRPAYADSGRMIAAVNTVAYDTSYKNVVIHDTLQFTYVAGSEGFYEYSDTNFFPLDNRGFGNEGKNHNYSFTAAIHKNVQYEPGLVFNFQSNDDMWVFLNGMLVIDLGGLGSLRTSQVNLDNIPGLKAGVEYPLDVFWTQRSEGSSSVKVSMNVVIGCPAKWTLGSLLPHDTSISYGDSLVLSLTMIYDSCGIRHHLDSLIQWKLAIPTAGSLRTDRGPTNTYYSVGTGGITNFIIASLNNPANPTQLFVDSTIVYVKPPPMIYHLYIEPDTNISLNGPNPGTRLYIPDSVSLVSISQDDTGAQSVAAILRDKYGNFVRFSSNALWQVVGDTGIVEISTPDKPYVCAIAGLKPGTTYIRLSDDSGSVPDTVMVENQHAKTSVRQAAGQNRFTLKTIHEYFNLRGQKLPLYGIRHADGIVLERIIQPDGKANIRKIIPGIKSR